MGYGIQPLISVVIPTYNCAKYLPDAIESVLSQTYKNIEIIVVDDGSTDNTSAALEKYSERIHVRRQKNMGLSAARNAGFKMSKGHFICFLDSDDTLLPDKFTLQIEAFRKNPETDIFISGYINVEENGETEISRAVKHWETGALRKLLIHEVFPVHTALIRRNILENSMLFPENIVTGESQEDWQLWLSMALADARFSSIPEYTCKYRHRAGAITSFPLRHLDGARRVVRFLRNHPRAGEFKKQIDELEAIIEMERVAASLRTGDVILAEKELLQAVTRFMEYWENPDWYHIYFRRRLTFRESASWQRNPDLNLYRKIVINELLPMMKKALPAGISRRLEGAICLSFNDIAYNLRESSSCRSRGIESLLLNPWLCLGKKGRGAFLRSLVGPEIGGIIGKINRVA